MRRSRSFPLAAMRPIGPLLSKVPARPRSRGPLNPTIREPVMKVVSHALRFAVACLLLTLGACGGGGDEGSGTGTPSTGAVIGAAGGTVIGPNGAKVEIPPGALAATRRSPSSRRRPARRRCPAGHRALRHRCSRSRRTAPPSPCPVTLTLPFDPASVPAGTTPTLYKTNAAESVDAGRQRHLRRQHGDRAGHELLVVAVASACCSCDPTRVWEFACCSRPMAAMRPAATATRRWWPAGRDRQLRPDATSTNPDPHLPSRCRRDGVATG